LEGDEVDLVDVGQRFTAVSLGRIAERLPIRIQSGQLADDLADWGKVCPVTREVLDH